MYPTGVPPATVQLSAPDSSPAGFEAAWEEFLGAVRRAQASTGEREPELTLSQYHLLQGLRDHPGLSVGKLAEAAGIRPATATRVLDGLERDGVVERSRSAADRRAVTVALTAGGRRRLERKRRALGGHRRALAERLAPEERAQAERLLRHLAELLGEL